MPPLSNMLGQEFGRLVVLQKSSRRNKSGNAYWKVKCVCGIQKEVVGSELSNGNTKSCGCLRREVAGKIKDRTGELYGRLTAIKWVDSDERGQTKWSCQCICGNQVTVRGNDLQSGATKSCGCLQKEKTSIRHTTHGLSKTPEYKNFKVREREERKRKLDNCWNLDMEKVLIRLQPVCVVCGSDDRLCTDHVKPLSKGFGFKPGNAVRLCVSCNSIKRDKDLSNLPIGWRIKIEKANIGFKRVWENSF